MAHGAGARSQSRSSHLSSLWSSCFLFLPGPLKYLPYCVLASALFTIAVGMIDVKGLKAIMQESFLFIAAAVPGIGVEQGTLVGGPPK
jgi:MFS superfamily sulfate permease-like transporter